MADPIHSVHIPTAEHRTSPSAHIAYRLDIQAAVRAWTVWRRYSQFHQLHQSLLSIHPDHPPPVLLPAKHYFSLSSTASSPAAIESRRRGLEKYLYAILTDQDPRWRRTHEWREFLGVSTARSFTEDRFTAESWMEELQGIQGALRECRVLLRRREASSGNSNTAEVHRCTLDARRRLQGLSEQVRALDAGLRMLAASSGVSGDSSRRRQNRVGNIAYDTDGDDGKDGADSIGEEEGEGEEGEEEEEEEKVKVEDDDDDDDNIDILTENECARRHNLLEAVRTELRTLTRQVEGRTGSSKATSTERDRHNLSSSQSMRSHQHNATNSHANRAPASARRPASASRPSFGSEVLATEAPGEQPLSDSELLHHRQTPIQHQKEHSDQFSQTIRRQRSMDQPTGEELELHHRMLNGLDINAELATDHPKQAN